MKKVTVLPNGNLKRIHVIGADIRRNLKDGGNRPTVAVRHSKGPTKGHRARINGPSEVVYSPDKPLSSGARVWVETRAAVVVIKEDTNEEATEGP